MKYFENFPNILYTFKDPSLNDFDQVTDIFTRVKMLDSIISNVQVYYTYPVKDSDRPDIIAEKYYGDPERDWIILFTNKILDPYFQWPMDQYTLLSVAISNYGSLANAESTLDHIEKHTIITTTQFGSQNTWTYIDQVSPNVIAIDGSTLLPTINTPAIIVGGNNVTTFSDGSIVDRSEQLIAISGYQQLFNENEANRNIKLIQAGFVQQIEQELLTLLTQ